MAEHAARGARTQRIGVSRAEAGGLTQERGSGSAAELLMGLQRAAGNTAVARLVSAGGAIQRELIIGGWPVAPDWIDQPSLNEVIGTEAKAANISANTVLPKLVEMIGTGRHVHDTDPEAVRAATQDVAWDRLKRRPDVEVVYRTPPLTQADARAVIANVERGEPNALQGLRKQGRAFAPEGPAIDRGHEWGILKAKTRTDECVLTIGDTTGVDWDPELLYCGIGIAHSHPYWTRGPARHAPEAGQATGSVSTLTKEIADHQIDGDTVAGAVLWSDLDSRTELLEMKKIFPSASDVAFSAKHDVRRHTVYTPYLVLSPDAGTRIANPDVEQGRWARVAARLRFEIRDARHLADNDYACELAAFANDVQFWSKQIVASMKAQTLKW